MIVSTLFSMCSNEFIFIFISDLLSNTADHLIVFLNIDHIFLVKASFLWLMNQLRYCVVCHDVFLLTASVILVVV